MKSMINTIRRSIPFKICLSILLIETILLTILGFYYTARFNTEIDTAVHEKLLLPSILMSDRALNYETVRDAGVMSELIKEDVLKCFVVNREGTIFYGSEGIMEGTDYRSHLEETELEFFADKTERNATFSFSTSDGKKLTTVFAPLRFNDQILGNLYLQIDASNISSKKRHVALLFFIGALCTIIFTTVLEALLVYRLVVPRLKRTSHALSNIEEYRFATRIKDYGPPDELGKLMEQVDGMISKVEYYLNNVLDAEKKYRDLFMSAREGIFRLSARGILLDGNPALAQLLGYDSFTEMEQSEELRLSRYVADEHDLDRAREELFKKDDLQNYEIDVKRRDGQIVTVSLFIHRICDSRGTLKGYEGRIVDITEKKRKQQAEQDHQAAVAVARAKTEMVTFLEDKNSQLEQALSELRATQEQLLQSEKMAVLGMTAGGVAHDLNNILTGITGYPEFLLMEIPDDSSLRQPLEAILSSGKRASAVVSDMLTLSKGVASKRENTSLNRLVTDYLESLEFRQLLSDNEHIELITELSERNVNIHCSPIHIQKVIMNLITNSVEAMDRAGRLRVSTYSTPADDGSQSGGEVVERYSILEIADTGGGISEEDLEHIFDPFYTRKVMGLSGTGLGLTIVQNVVREHGGHIELTSGSAGTIFKVYLPAGYEPAGEMDELEVDEDLTGAGTVLFVDDEPLQRDLGFRYLSTLGYSVKTAASGEEAIEHLRTADVDLVVLDMIMAPGINGLETYRRIIQDKPGQRALIVSGFAPDDEIQVAHNLGVGGFVSKPYSISQLGKGVKEVMAGKGCW